MSKKLFWLIVLVIPASAIFGQVSPDSLYTMGETMYAQKNYPAAISCFKKVVEGDKAFTHYNQAIYNLAYIYDEADSVDQARQWYEFIRASDMKDNEKVWGRGIMEPYANYKHHSTFNLASRYYNNKEYEKALQYYQECRTRFPYYNSSGTDLRMKRNQLSVYIGDCYTALKKFDEALLTIVPEALDSEGINGYESLSNLVIDFIDKNFDRKKIAAELETAFKKMTYQKDENGFQMKWRGKSILLTPYASGESDPAQFIGNIKKTSFWTALTQ